MGRPLKLEVFETLDLPEGPALMMPEDLEVLRLQAYEEGYKAGWDDALAERAEKAEALHAALMQKVEQLSFGYFEARGHILGALRPLFEAMIGTVLPSTARAALAPRVVEALMPLAVPMTEQPVTLRVAPGEGDSLRSAIEGLVLPPLDIVEDPDLRPDEALIDREPQQIHVDLGGIVRDLSAAIDEFYDINQKEARHV